MTTIFKYPRRVAALAGALLAVVLLSAGFVRADSLPGEPLTVGPVTGGTNRLDITVDQFDVIVDTGNIEVTARLLPDSIRWARVYKSLVVPRALLEVTLPGTSVLLSAQYKDASHLFQQEEGRVRALFYVSLFDTATVASGRWSR